MGETKTDLQLAFSALNQQFHTLKTEAETKEDQLCEYKRQLELIKERELHFLHEIDVLQCHEKPEVNKLRGRIKQLQDELSQLQDYFKAEGLKLDDELAGLQNELKIHSENTVSSTIDSFRTTADEVSEEQLLLENELQILSDALCEKQMSLDHLEIQNTKFVESVNNLQAELKLVHESTEFKKQELTEAYDLMNNLQENFLITKTEFEALKGKSIIVSKNDENSLFAEVNDGRLKLQEILLDLSEKCNKMKLEVSNKQKQLCALRLFNEELTNILKNDPVEQQRDYEIMFDTYTSRIAILKNLIEKYKSLVLEIEELLLNGFPSNLTEFLNSINEKTRKMEQELNDAAGMEFRGQKMMSIQLKEILLNIQEWKTTNSQLESKSSDCEINIKKLISHSNNPSLEMKEANECDDGENSANYNDEIKCAEERSAVEESSKENSPQIANASESKPNEKRVMFSTDTKSSSNHIVRKGGKILQCKSIHIPSLIKKN